MGADNTYYQRNFAVADAEVFHHDLDSSEIKEHAKKAVVVKGDQAVEVMVKVGATMVNWTLMTDYVSSAGTGGNKVTYINIPFPCNQISINFTNAAGYVVHVSYYGGV